MTTTDANRAAIDSLVAPTPFVGTIAVSYLRVSTKEQAEKGGSAEGFSIPAQREANQRKADQLGATIVEEFVDAGESARKADRPELMRMIQYVTKYKTNYCIVHKVDLLARNRADDVTIHLALGHDLSVLRLRQPARRTRGLHPSSDAHRARRAAGRAVL